MSMNLKPIVLLPARERIAAALRKSIIARDMVEGEQITLDTVAGLLGVSKTPVREAFLMLESEGLIKLTPNRGAVVLGITPSTMRQHFHIRAALESEAAMMCCQTDVDISPIEEVYMESQQAISAQRMEEYSNLNQAFHVAIWRCADNERMNNMLSVMWNGLSMRYMETLEDYAKKSFSEHSRIMAAIRARQSEAARNAMHDHIMRSMGDMLTNLERETPQPER